MNRHCRLQGAFHAWHMQTTPSVYKRSCTHQDKPLAGKHLLASCMEAGWHTHCNGRSSWHISTALFVLGVLVQGTHGLQRLHLFFFSCCRVCSTACAAFNSLWSRLICLFNRVCNQLSPNSVNLNFNICAAWLVNPPYWTRQELFILEWPARSPHAHTPTCGRCLGAQVPQKGGCP